MADSKYIVHGPSDVDAPLNMTFSEYVYQQFMEGGDKIAQVRCDTGDCITYTKMLQQACNLATSLRKLGVKKGDVVCISSENRFEFSISAIAIMLAGAVNATLNVLYTRHELLHAMNISQPKIVICTDANISSILDAIKEIPTVQKVIYMGDKSTHADIHLYKDLVKEQVDVHKFKITEVGVHDPMAILFSSGTTGLIKGVLLTHRNFAMCSGYLKKPLLKIRDNGRGCVLMIMPWFHAYGFVTHMYMLTLNVKYVFMVRFKEEPFLKALQNYKITMTMLAPPLMIFLAKNPMVDKYDLTSLKEIWCGAAPLSKELQQAVSDKLKDKCDVKQGYGLTEATLGVTHFGADDNRNGSCGKCIAGAQIKVVDINDGKILGPKKTGEICIKGPMVMAGYYRNDEATKTTIDSEKWLHTGDIGYYDDEGYFFIVDRLKELIKYKGYQVPPAELEAIILQFSKVKDVGVVGLPDETSGELPLAFIVKQAGVDLSEKDVVDFVASRVSHHKRLHGGVRFVDEIPKNPSRKILRRKLREMLNKAPKSKL